ncbi:TetR/AcrR family transcriptional regulator [uncultured Jannaschia sp.]|uniref:TetR/AcrR family transcriptional regulator n=1 Tax=uncultured Jannaschia sp. TaxID=293347 RepID=UPI00261C47B1|nr:TetR/AcrR family transcriptional regulator [uncultured Jannaschia sp.]
MPKIDAADQADTKSAVVAVATDHFLTHGYAATSMSAIAAASGLGKASLYHHFASKEHLFIAAITQGLTASAQQMRQVANDASLGHEDRVRQAMVIVYDACVLSAAGRMAPIVAETSRIIPSVARDFHDSFIDAMKGVMCDIVTAGVRDGVFRQRDPVGLYHMTFGPPVNLAISRAMFADIPGAAQALDVEYARRTQTDMLLELLHV